MATDTVDLDQEKLKSMVVRKIVIIGLFGRFDHSLELAKNDPITIMIGPNGFGKTTILNAINVLFNRPLRYFSKLPFGSFSVEFDDASKIEVRGNIVNKKQSSEIEVSYISPYSERQSFSISSLVAPRGLAIPTDEIDDAIPILRRIGSDEWVNRNTGEHLDLGDILEQFGEHLPWNDETQKSICPKWFSKIRKLVSVRLIDTERLTPPSRRSGPRARRHFYPNMAATERTINQYSRYLSDEVERSLTKYGELSQSLDRTFPSRVIAESPQPSITIERLQQDLSGVEEKRSKLVDAGLLVQKHEDLDSPSSFENIDVAKQGVLAVYARDAKEKLSLFDDLYKKIDTLRRIANERLLHKTVSISGDGLKVTSEEGTELDLAMLSSGEQHELVILCELLFRVPENGFILFDEPELSFHVAWQEKFLDDLGEIAEIANFRVLLATHSPQIICDRWDLTVELKGPNDL